jgi:hypothetical protein
LKNPNLEFRKVKKQPHSTFDFKIAHQATKKENPVLRARTTLIFPILVNYFFPPNLVIFRKKLVKTPKSSILGVFTDEIERKNRVSFFCGLSCETNGVFLPNILIFSHIKWETLQQVALECTGKDEISLLQKKITFFKNFGCL